MKDRFYCVITILLSCISLLVDTAHAKEHNVCPKGSRASVIVYPVYDVPKDYVFTDDSYADTNLPIHQFSTQLGCYSQEKLSVVKWKNAKKRIFNDKGLAQGDIFDIVQMHYGFLQPVYETFTEGVLLLPNGKNAPEDQVIQIYILQ